MPCAVTVPPVAWVVVSAEAPDVVVTGEVAVAAEVDVSADVCVELELEELDV